jgi:hypothetical protein
MTRITAERLLEAWQSVAEVPGSPKVASNPMILYSCLAANGLLSHALNLPLLYACSAGLAATHP